MANEYLNRYQFFTANDQQNTIPYINIPLKNWYLLFINI